MILTSEEIQLIDLHATMAMNALLSAGTFDANWPYEKLAEQSHALALAMLAERRKVLEGNGDNSLVATLNECPECGGEADNGHDRCVPPSAYLCKKCTEKKDD